MTSDLFDNIPGADDMSTGSKVRDKYVYVLKDEDVRSASNGIDVLKNAVASIMHTGNETVIEHYLEFLRDVNRGRLAFKSNMEIEPIIGSGSKELHAGKELLVPYNWPIDQLTPVKSFYVLSPSRHFEQTSQVDPSGVVFTGDDEDEDSSSTWLILGAVALAIGGTWWMMSKNK